MAVDDSICTSHEKNRVALYCQTCEVLICTKCVSHAPNSTGRHREHVYLDISEAYDMLQDELEKIISGISSNLQDRKNEKQQLQSNLQKLQLALLRKKTQIGKCTKSFKDQLSKKDKQFVSSVEQIIAPTINTTEELYKSVEYDVVSTEGLLGSAESLQQLDKSRSITFLKSISNVKKEYEEKTNQKASVQEDSSHTVQTLIDVSLNLHREKYMLDRAFSLAEKVPDMPHPLLDWCVFGYKSASIVWKFNKRDTIKTFHVYYKEFSNADLKFVKNNCVSADIKRLNEFLKHDVKLRGSTKSEELSEQLDTSPVKCNNDKGNKWYHVWWYFGGKSVEYNGKQTLKTVNHVTLEESTEQNVDDIKNTILSSGQNTEKVNNTKDKVVNSKGVESDLSSSSQGSEYGSEGSSKTSSEEPRRIRKLSYTISPEKSRFVEPYDFLNDSLNGNKDAQTSVSTSHQSRLLTSPQSVITSNKRHRTTLRQSSLTSDNTSITSTKTTQRKNSVASSRCPRAGAQNKDILSKRITIRTQSLEAVRKPMSSVISQPRSSTPQRYSVQGQNINFINRQRSRLQSTPKDVNVPSKNGVPRSDGFQVKARLSRWDQVKNNNVKTYDLLQQSSEFDDENMKDIYNEKSHLKKMSVDSDSPFKIRGSYESYMKENNDESKENTENEVFLSRQDNENNKNCNIVGEKDFLKGKKSFEKSKAHKENRNSNKPSVQKNNNLCEKVKQKTKKANKTEYVSMEDINTDTRKLFRQFKVSKFVPGRVQASLRDLKPNTNYIAIISASNHCGESDGVVVNFKTGVMSKDGSGGSKCGHMLETVDSHKKSWGSFLSNQCAYLICFICLVVYIFVVFCLFSEYLQGLFCRSISTGQDLVNYCPDIAITKVCSGYMETVNTHCDQLNEVLNDLHKEKQPSWIEQILRLFNL